MRLIKKINNNYALALDSNGEEIIVEGKGIGFIKMPCEMTDLSIVSRTYYNVNTQDVALINEVDEKLLEICNKIFDFATETVGEKINPNLTFILADHIQFSIERYEKNIEMKMPIYYDVEYMYPKESKVSEYALKLIFEELHILLPEEEKTGIAMNIINSELYQGDNNSNYQELVNLCTSVVEKAMNIKIRRDTFNYSRFVSHLHYLFKRVGESITLSSDNLNMYKTISQEYPQACRCADIMEDILAKKKLILNKEEKIYLIMHINRLCAREDCNLQGHNPTSNK